MEGDVVTMTQALTTAISGVIDVFTSNVVPLLTTEPFVYFLGMSLFGCACGIFAMVKRTV